VAVQALDGVLAHLAERFEAALRVHVGYGDGLHAGDVGDLGYKAPAHLPGAHEPNPDGRAGPL
jgi:hypothetical protein